MTRCSVSILLPCVSLNNAARAENAARRRMLAKRGEIYARQINYAGLENVPDFPYTVFHSFSFSPSLPTVPDVSLEQETEQRLS